MLVKDIKLGLRVIVSTNDLIAIVVGKPEYYTPTSKLVRIKYEHSTKFDTLTNHMITALPLNEQHVALGGSYQGEP